MKKTTKGIFVTKEAFREQAGATSRETLKGFSEESKAALIMILVQFSMNLEEKLFGEVELDGTSKAPDTLQP